MSELIVLVHVDLSFHKAAGTVIATELERLSN